MSSPGLYSEVATDPEFVLYNFSTTIDFAPGPVPQSQARPSNVPHVSHGIMWGNLYDRAWLFGGKTWQGHAANEIWRFERRDSEGEWTKLGLADSVAAARPVRGADCNVPDLQKGFYLGGMAEENENGTRYLHSLAVFNMEDETLTMAPVPDFVPVVNQSLVYIDTGTRAGALAALGGVLEQNRSLSMVYQPCSSLCLNTAKEYGRHWRQFLYLTFSQGVGTSKQSPAKREV